MSETRVFSLNAREYQKQFERVFRNGKKSAKEFGEQQTKLFLKEAIELTPPGGKGTTGQAAKKRGEEAVETDLNRLFVGVNKGQAEGVDLAQKHRSARTSRGRIRKKPARVWKVRKAELASYIAKVKRMVGWLAAGLNIAASRFGYKPPQWVWRHPTPGAVDVRFSDRGFFVRVTNSAGFASNVKDLNRRFQWALDNRAKALKRLADDYAKKLKAGTKLR